MAQVVRSGAGGGSDRSNASSPRHGGHGAREYDRDRLLSGWHQDDSEHTGADRVEPGREADERLHLRYRSKLAGMGGEAFRWSLCRFQGTNAQSIDSWCRIRETATATERGSWDRGSYHPQLPGPLAARKRCPADTRTR